MADNNFWRDTAQAASNSVASGVSGPVDLISWLMQKGGMPMNGPPVGGSEWMAKKKFTKPVDDHAAGILGETLGMVTPMGIAAKAPQIARGLLAAGENLAKPAARGLLADQRGAVTWHGTPHKFDKFDAGKIGTGEGAQAYGHGIYVAESEAVGRDYANVLASPRNRAMDGKGVYIEPSPIGDGAWRLSKPNYDGRAIGSTGDATVGLTDYDFPNVAAALKHAKNNGMISRNGRPSLTEITSEGGYNPVRSASQMEDPNYGQLIASDPGNLYKIDLPDEHIAKMLDWDKLLSEQGQFVQDSIRKVLIGSGQSPSIADYIIQNKSGRDALSTIGRGSYDARLLPPDGAAAVKSSAMLKDAGIPGIRYLDGGSRGTGAGTSNYVVFPGNEDMLSILERNGKPILGGQ